MKAVIKTATVSEKSLSLNVVKLICPPKVRIRKFEPVIKVKILLDYVKAFIVPQCNTFITFSKALKVVKFRDFR
jgi:hypothetical protein